MLSDINVTDFESSVSEFATTYNESHSFIENGSLITYFNPLDREYPDMRHHKRWAFLTRPRSRFDKQDNYLNRLTQVNHERYTGWNNVELFCKWFNKPMPIVRDRFYFYTFTGVQRIEDNQENIDRLHNIAKDIFNNNSWKRYKDVCFNIECGKHVDNSNLHIHALIDFEKSNKNFERDFHNRWMKDFKGYGLDFKKGGKQFYKGKNVNDIWYDKLSYLRNDDKSILHQNYRDLGIFEHVE